MFWARSSISESIRFWLGSSPGFLWLQSRFVVTSEAALLALSSSRCGRGRMGFSLHGSNRPANSSRRWIRCRPRYYPGKVSKPRTTDRIQSAAVVIEHLTGFVFDADIHGFDMQVDAAIVLGVELGVIHHSSSGLKFRFTLLFNGLYDNMLLSVSCDK